MFEVSITYPNRNIELAGVYVSLEFGEKFRNEDTYVGVIGI